MGSEVTPLSPQKEKLKQTASEEEFPQPTRLQTGHFWSTCSCAISLPLVGAKDRVQVAKHLLIVRTNAALRGNQRTLCLCYPDLSAILNATKKMRSKNEDNSSGMWFITLWAQLPAFQFKYDISPYDI
jgi:hypothetical protein